VRTLVNGLFAVTTANTDTVDDESLLGLVDREWRKESREGRRETASSSTSVHAAPMVFYQVCMGATARGSKGGPLSSRETERGPRSNLRGVEFGEEMGNGMEVGSIPFVRRALSKTYANFDVLSSYCLTCGPIVRVVAA
jgi:hypothetical protein